MIQATENNHNEGFVSGTAELSQSVYSVITSYKGPSTNKWLALSGDTVAVLAAFTLGGEWGGSGWMDPLSLRQENIEM